MNDQPNYIIFKLYRNTLYSFFSYQSQRRPNDQTFPAVDIYEEIIQNLDSVTKEHNRKMIFTSSFGDNDANFFVNTPYLEVLYTGELPQEERDLYIGLVKTLFGDGDRFFGHLEAFTPELVVRFSKLPNDDFFRVIPESNLDKMLARFVKY